VSRELDWVWDVARQRGLFVTSFIIDFKRKIGAKKQVDEKLVRRGLFGR
jgi:hypothetical protein